METCDRRKKWNDACDSLSTKTSRFNMGVSSAASSLDSLGTGVFRVLHRHWTALEHGIFHRRSCGDCVIAASLLQHSFTSELIRAFVGITDDCAVSPFVWKAGVNVVVFALRVLHSSRRGRARGKRKVAGRRSQVAVLVVQRSPKEHFNTAAI